MICMDIFSSQNLIVTHLQTLISKENLLLNFVAHFVSYIFVHICAAKSSFWSLCNPSINLALPYYLLL